MSRNGHQALKRHFWFFVYIDGVEIVDSACIVGFFTGFPSKIAMLPSVGRTCQVLSKLQF